METVETDPHLYQLLMQFSVKETYEKMVAILNAIKYKQFNWQIYGDLKI